MTAVCICLIKGIMVGPAEGVPSAGQLGQEHRRRPSDNPRSSLGRKLQEKRQGLLHSKQRNLEGSQRQQCKTRKMRGKGGKRKKQKREEK